VNRRDTGREPALRVKGHLSQLSSDGGPGMGRPSDAAVPTLAIDIHGTELRVTTEVEGKNIKMLIDTRATYSVLLSYLVSFPLILAKW
jgi:hypothetical protein